MATSYTTQHGQRWDEIAVAVYGTGAEALFDLLVEANPAHAATDRFAGGVVLSIPDAPDERVRPVSAPPWKRP